MSVRLSVVLGAAVLCLAASHQALAAHAAQRSQCQRLRGVDRAPDRLVKLVKRPTRERLADGTRGSRLVGCVLPRGPVHAIARRASVENEWAQEFSYLVRQVAGRFVLLDQRGTEGGYAAETRTTVWDLGNGRSYGVARHCSDKYGNFCSPEHDLARKALLTTDGHAVAALERWPEAGLASIVVIASFAPDGTQRVLDIGPPGDLPRESLALKGSIASWSHAGEPRSADIR